MKLSLKVNGLLTKSACIAGVLVSRPNFKALCGRDEVAVTTQELNLPAELV